MRRKKVVRKRLPTNLLQTNTRIQLTGTSGILAQSLISTTVVRVFTTKHWATKHAEMHSHPFRCQHFHCKERFETVEEAIKHSYDDKHPLATVFLCPVLGCLGAEAGYHLPKDGIPKHRMAHVRAGDIEEDDEFKVEEVEGSLPWSDLPLFINILNHHSLDLTNPIEVDGGGSPETGGSDDGRQP